MHRLFFGALAACAVTGCATPEQSGSGANPSAQAAGPVSITAGSAAFGLDLYARIAADHDGDIALSPASLSSAFALAYPGARAETAEEIARVLRFAPDDAAFRNDMAAFQTLMQVERAELAISLANAAWFDEQTVVEPDYLAGIKTAYGADEHRADFRGDPDAAREEINDWVEARTKDRIVDLLSPDHVSEETRFVLVNALHFEGKWWSRFDAADTEEGDFTLASGDAVTADMMRLRDSFQHYNGRSFSAVSLPYEDGEYSMVIFLPARDNGLAQFEKQLSAPALARWLDELDNSEPQDVDLKLPKVEQRLSYELKEPLISMGLERSFTDLADFHAMVDPAKQPPRDQLGVKIGEVVHQIFLKIGEEGTEAAAATAIEGIVITGSRIRPPPVEFHADHPFFYVLRHNASGAILFMGRIADPS